MSLDKWLSSKQREKEAEAKARLKAAEIAKLTPEGGTNLGDALDLAYETARHHYLANGDNRVVLLTDGAANLGDVKPEVLKQKVEAHRKQGVALESALQTLITGLAVRYYRAVAGSA